MLNKRGEIEKNELLELILAIAALLVLILLLYSIYSMYSDRDENAEAAKSYMKSFDGVMDEAKDGGGAKFSLWQEKLSDVVMVVFQEGTQRTLIRSPTDSQIVTAEFFTIKTGGWRVCFCYKKDDKWECESCESYDDKIVTPDYEVFFKGCSVDIKYVDGVYNFGGKCDAK